MAILYSELSRIGVVKDLSSLNNAEYFEGMPAGEDKNVMIDKVKALLSWWTPDNTITVTLTAADSLSGVAKTLYSVNGGAYAEGTSVKVPKNSVNQIAYYSIDQAGNTETSHSMTVSTGKPVVTMDLNGEYALGTTLQLNYSAKDDQSGIAAGYMSVTYPGAAGGQALLNGKTRSSLINRGRILYP
ncbi:hypothetical protein LJK87_45730 [Paenibacillus sp. P25]|nr:hypothetical protein LJK87_45730 [Paenibacillus sp. P25]